ncbi:hypothetical protein [Allonocardiopsis opalescens]|uniref:Uncharacterized protein n=1 Tax=Allonocardiopsis opalescens TaxID=1144618 RepID=A0A2T0Q2Q3_9ACTN|nr:hypothetical protein [Allonocardiopsis opalescens]PRX98071.1 hypothetical protein CLV72_105424 [Allonocardiopsis opalescens]
MRNPWTIVPALLLAAGLAGCGGGAQGDETTGTGAAGGGAATGAAAAGEAMLAFYDCMRDHGIDVPDPDPNNPRIDTSQFDMDDPATQEALQDCRSEMPNGGEPPPADEERMAAMRDFTACMQENGIDMPDPNADGSLSMPEGADPNSAEFQEAMGACRSSLGGQPVMFGPPGGRQ